MCHVHSSGMCLRLVWVHSKLSPLYASYTLCSLSQFVWDRVSISILATPSIAVLCNSLKAESRLVF